MSQWQRRHPRGAVKRVLLELLEETGATGLNARLAVAMAAARGIEVDRTTLSSLLSRLKAEQIVAHDGYRYRLRSNKTRPELESPAADAWLRLRAG
jgi:arginine repressor